MAKLSAYGRTEVVTFTKEDDVTTDSSVDWRRTKLRLMSDGQILIKVDVRWKASGYSEAYKGGWPWKKWAKVKNWTGSPEDIDKFRAIAIKRGFREE